LSNKDAVLGDAALLSVHRDDQVQIKKRDLSIDHSWNGAGRNSKAGEQFAVTMSQGSGIKNQRVVESDNFPRDGITKSWDEGYHVTAATGSLSVSVTPNAMRSLTLSNLRFKIELKGFYYD
jgi:hypothetical protein